MAQGNNFQQFAFKQALRAVNHVGMRMALVMVATMGGMPGVTVIPPTTPVNNDQPSGREAQGTESRGYARGARSSKNPEKNKRAKQQLELEAQIEQPITIAISDQGYVKRIEGHVEQGAVDFSRPGDAIAVVIHADASQKVQITAKDEAGGEHNYVLSPDELPRGKSAPKFLGKFIDDEHAQDLASVVAGQGVGKKPDQPKATKEEKAAAAEERDEVVDTRTRQQRKRDDKREASGRGLSGKTVVSQRPTRTTNGSLPGAGRNESVYIEPSLRGPEFDDDREQTFIPARTRTKGETNEREENAKTRAKQRRQGERFKDNNIRNGRLDPENTVEAIVARSVAEDERVKAENEYVAWENENVRQRQVIEQQRKEREIRERAETVATSSPINFSGRDDGIILPTLTEELFIGPQVVAAIQPIPAHENDGLAAGQTIPTGTGFANTNNEGIVLGDTDALTALAAAELLRRTGLSNDDLATLGLNGGGTVGQGTENTQRGLVDTPEVTERTAGAPEVTERTAGAPEVTERTAGASEVTERTAGASEVEAKKEQGVGKIDDVAPEVVHAFYDVVALKLGGNSALTVKEVGSNTRVYDVANAAGEVIATINNPRGYTNGFEAPSLSIDVRSDEALQLLQTATELSIQRDSLLTPGTHTTSDFNTVRSLLGNQVVMGVPIIGEENISTFGYGKDLSPNTIFVSEQDSINNSYQLRASEELQESVARAVAATEVFNNNIKSGLLATQDNTSPDYSIGESRALAGSIMQALNSNTLYIRFFNENNTYVDAVFDAETKDPLLAFAYAGSDDKNTTVAAKAWVDVEKVQALGIVLPPELGGDSIDTPPVDVKATRELSADEWTKLQEQLGLETQTRFKLSEDGKNIIDTNDNDKKVASIAEGASGPGSVVLTFEAALPDLKAVIDAGINSEAPSVDTVENAERQALGLSLVNTLEAIQTNSKSLKMKEWDKFNDYLKAQPTKRFHTHYDISDDGMETKTTILDTNNADKPAAFVAFTDDGVDIKFVGAQSELQALMARGKSFETPDTLSEVQAVKFNHYLRDSAPNFKIDGDNIIDTNAGDNKVATYTRQTGGSVVIDYIDNSTQIKDVVKTGKDYASVDLLSTAEGINLRAYFEENPEKNFSIIEPTPRGTTQFSIVKSDTQEQIATYSNDGVITYVNDAGNELKTAVKDGRSYASQKKEVTLSEDEWQKFNNYLTLNPALDIAIDATASSITHAGAKVASFSAVDGSTDMLITTLRPQPELDDAIDKGKVFIDSTRLRNSEWRNFKDYLVVQPTPKRYEIDYSDVDPYVIDITRPAGDQRVAKVDNNDFMSTTLEYVGIQQAFKTFVETARTTPERTEEQKVIDRATQSGTIERVDAQVAALYYARLDSGSQIPYGLEHRPYQVVNGTDLESVVTKNAIYLNPDITGTEREDAHRTAINHATALSARIDEVVANAVTITLETSKRDYKSAFYANLETQYSTPEQSVYKNNGYLNQAGFERLDSMDRSYEIQHFVTNKTNQSISVVETQNASHDQVLHIGTEHAGQFKAAEKFAQDLEALQATPKINISNTQQIVDAGKNFREAKRKTGLFSSVAAFKETQIETDSGNIRKVFQDSQTSEVVFSYDVTVQNGQHYPIADTAYATISEDVAKYLNKNTVATLNNKVAATTQTQPQPVPNPALDALNRQDTVGRNLNASQINEVADALMGKREVAGQRLFGMGFQKYEETEEATQIGHRYTIANKKSGVAVFSYETNQNDDPLALSARINLAEVQGDLGGVSDVTKKALGIHKSQTQQQSQQNQQGSSQSTQQASGGGARSSGGGYNPKAEIQVTAPKREVAYGVMATLLGLLGLGALAEDRENAKKRGEQPVGFSKVMNVLLGTAVTIGAAAAIDGARGGHAAKYLAEKAATFRNR